MKTLKDLLIGLNACKPAIEWAGDKTIEEVVETCHKGDWLLCLAQKVDIGIRPLTLAKGHCANTVRHLMKDKRSLKAVDIAIAFGEGKATMEELDDANFAAAGASYAADSARASYTSLLSATNAVDRAAYTYAARAADYTAWAASAAHNASYAAYYDAHTAYEALVKNEMQTADICRKYIGDLIIDKVNKQLKTT